MTIQYTPKVQVNTDKARYTENELLTDYTYENTIVEKQADGTYNVTPTSLDFEFKVDLKTPKTGLLLVGLGGNNGTTLVGSVLANKHNISFETKTGIQQPNYYGSVTQASTVKLGIDSNGRDVYAPFNSLLPLVHPNDFVVGGWDISGLDLASSMRRSQVLQPDLVRKLEPYMKDIVPLPSVYYPDFIAANQNERADNCFNREGKDGEVSTKGKWSHVERIRSDIAEFKQKNDLDKVIVLWTANTERYAELIPGVNDTAENLIKAIKNDHEEVSASTIFAVACILDKIPYINGSPQNTFVPGCIELAETEGSFIGGDDFKSGQTKLKSVLAQFLVDAGIRPVSIASYNHLGNNDGYN